MQRRGRYLRFIMWNFNLAECHSRLFRKAACLVPVFLMHINNCKCIRMTYLYLFTVFVLLFVGKASVAATEYGQYPAGAFGQMKVAALPADGVTIIENGTLVYNAREFVSGNGSSQNFDTRVIANRTLGMHTTSLELFGADYAFAAAIPFGNFAAPRPLPGLKP